MKQLTRLICATIPVSFVGTMSWFGTYTFVNAYMVRGLGRSNEDWTLATLWYSGGMIFWYLLCTEISSRLGRRRTVTLGLGATALGYLALAGLRGFYPICVTLAVMGFTTVAGAVSWTPMVAEVGGEKPGRALALTVFVGTAVSVLCLLFGGALVASGNYPATFLVIGLACSASACAFHWISGPLEIHTSSAVVSLFRVSRHDWAALLRGPFLMVLVLGICADPFSFHTVNQLFPNLARDLHGFGEGSIGTLVALGRVPALISIYLVSRVIDRLNMIRCYAIGLLLDGVGTVLIGWAWGSATVMAAYLAFYLVHGIVWGANVAAVNRCLPAQLRDAGFALTWMLEVCSVFLVGIVHNRLLGSGAGLPMVFVYCGMVLAVASAGLLGYSHTKPYGAATRS